MNLLLVPLLQAAPAAAPPALEPRLEIVLPAGPAERALATLPEVEAAALVDWPRWIVADRDGAPGGWEDPVPRTDASSPWMRWATAVEDARGAGRIPSRDRAAGAARARAELGLLAAAQGRSDDAWGHWLQSQDDPAAARALLARLACGARPGALPDGCVLAPMLPPPADAPSVDPLARTRRRSISVQGLQVGDARLRLVLTLEPDGVQVDLQQLSGGACRVGVELPCPRRLAIGARYVDWLRGPEEQGSVLWLELPADGSEHTLWGRFVPADEPWPTLAPPAPLAAGDVWREGGLAFAGELDPVAAGLAAACERLFGIPAAPASAGALEARPAPIAIDLADRALRPRKLAALMGLAERVALTP